MSDEHFSTKSPDLLAPKERATVEPTRVPMTPSENEHPSANSPKMLTDPAHLSTLAKSQLNCDSQPPLDAKVLIPRVVFACARKSESEPQQDLSPVAALGALNPEQAPDANPECALAEGQVISPARWAERDMASDEPSFEEPCLERRGLAERRGAVFLHFCVECGRWGAYGYGATRNHPGRWYRRLHRP
jgi:hypothetical protein